MGLIEQQRRSRFCLFFGGDFRQTSSRRSDLIWEPRVLRVSCLCPLTSSCSCSLVFVFSSRFITTVRQTCLRFAFPMIAGRRGCITPRLHLSLAVLRIRVCAIHIRVQLNLPFAFRCSVLLVCTILHDLRFVTHLYTCTYPLWCLY